jgi:hypothetical protein
MSGQDFEQPGPVPLRAFAVPHGVVYHVQPPVTGGGCPVSEHSDQATGAGR